MKRNTILKRLCKHKLVVDTLVDKLAFQLEDAPVYITYIKKSEKKSILIIQDVGTTNRRQIDLEIGDSISHLLFLLSLIRDEYKNNILFTNNSHI